MENKNHTFSCYTYFNRVYDINQKISQINDVCFNPTIKLPKILLTIIFSLMAGLHSFNTIEEAIKDGDFDKFFGNLDLPGANTIPYALMAIDLDDLEKYTAEIIQKARYNKSLNDNLIDGLKVVAIDGTHVFTMKSDRLGKSAHKYEHTNDDGEITSIDYKEKAIPFTEFLFF